MDTTITGYEDGSMMNQGLHDVAALITFATDVSMLDELEIEIENNETNLIKYYDDHNIFILPSFTEGHPMVLLEALARLRPVIVFKDIDHVIEDKKGIFVAERNIESLVERIKFIQKNYESIQEEMKKNKLPTKQEFLESLINIIVKIN